jgi:hypothetical protein
MPWFERRRRSISDSAVAPLWVADHLDAVDDIGFGIARRIDLATDAFALAQLEEALGHGVVVAVAARAHAGVDDATRPSQAYRAPGQCRCSHH